MFLAVLVLLVLLWWAAGSNPSQDAANTFLVSWMIGVGILAAVAWWYS